MRDEKTARRVLVVDDEQSMREYLELLFERSGYLVSSASDESEAKEALGRQSFDVVISDMRLGDGSGLAVLRAAKALQLPPEVILITAFGTASTAVEAMREGAYDYISKPFDNDELLLLVQKALEKRELKEENVSLRERLTPGLTKLAESRSPRMQEIWKLIQKVAPSHSNVLICGESGTGKEVVARAIHNLGGKRSDQPFLPLNCAAIAEGVLESELFGHVKGTFTGAISDRQGILVSAREGTVLLDEVGEMPLGLQVKLLRALQERKVRPVGSATEVPFKARILAATNRKLEDEVREGRFREDLYYRLNVITIELPPLRARREDIVLLAERFREDLVRTLDRPSLRFAPETLDVLERYAFPGNVRQLQNIVERAVTLSDSDELGPESLPPALLGRPSPVPASAAVEIGDGFSLERHMDAEERRYLLAALEQAGGVKTRAAELIGLTFRSFRYRLAKHGLSEEVEEG